MLTPGGVKGSGLFAYANTKDLNIPASGVEICPHGSPHSFSVHSLVDPRHQGLPLKEGSHLRGPGDF